MTYDTATPRIASYVLVKNTEGKVAFLMRSNTSWMNGYYCLPSGKVEKGEPFSTAAAREALEEVGITIKPSSLKHILTMHRKEHDTEDNTWVDVFFEAEVYEGEVHNAEPEVHGEVAWFDLREIPEKTLPFIKAATGFIAEGRTFAEWGWDK